MILIMYRQAFRFATLYQHWSKNPLKHIYYLKIKKMKIYITFSIFDLKHRALCDTICRKINRHIDPVKAFINVSAHMEEQDTFLC